MLCLIIINSIVNYCEAEQMTKKNPFKFGDPVQGDYYLARPELESLVKQFIENKIHTVLIGPRRFGKTSFVINLLHNQELGPGVTTILMDIFNVTSHKDFLHQILRAVKGKRSFAAKLMDWMESLPRLRPRISWDIDPRTGESGFSISPELSEEDVKEAIQDALSLFGKMDDRVVVSIDEFQKVAELDDGGWLEATLRTHMQQSSNTVFLFTGSRKSVISAMMNGPMRPFYRSCQSLEFPAFGSEFTDWVIGRFGTLGITCDRNAIEELRKLTQDTPNYVQMACFHLVAQNVEHVGVAEIREVLKTIVRQNSYAYQTVLNSLTGIQQRALRLAANESEQIFSKELLRKYEIPSAPTMASVIKALKNKQILDEDTAKGKVIFDDPLFAIWLLGEFSS